MKPTFDITVPAQLGLKSFADENTALQREILLRAGEYIVHGPLQRWRVTATGAKDSNAVFVYRVHADDHAVRLIRMVLEDKFGTHGHIAYVGE